MKEWMRRFGLLTVVGVLACGALVAGCGGGEEEEAAPDKAKTEEKKPADDAE